MLFVVLLGPWFWHATATVCDECAWVTFFTLHSEHRQVISTHNEWAPVFTIEFQLYWFVYCKVIWEALFTSPPCTPTRRSLGLQFYQTDWPYRLFNLLTLQKQIRVAAGKKQAVQREEREVWLANEKQSYFTWHPGDGVLLVVWFLPVGPLWVTVDQQDGSMPITAPFPGSLTSFQQIRSAQISFTHSFWNTSASFFTCKLLKHK